MKRIFAFLILVAAVVCVSVNSARATFGAYAPYAITGPTNAPIFLTNTVQVYIPQVSFSAVATNNVSFVTNYLVTSFTNAAGTFSFSSVQTFVYSSATMGQNFTTNFPPQNLTIPVLTGYQAIPAVPTTNIVGEIIN